MNDGTYIDLRNLMIATEFRLDDDLVDCLVAFVRLVLVDIFDAFTDLLVTLDLSWKRMEKSSPLHGA